MVLGFFDTVPESLYIANVDNSLFDAQDFQFAQPLKNFSDCLPGAPNQIGDFLVRYPCPEDDFVPGRPLSAVFRQPQDGPPDAQAGSLVDLGHGVAGKTQSASQQLDDI